MSKPIIKTWTADLEERFAEEIEWVKALPGGHLRVSSTPQNTHDTCPYLYYDRTLGGNKLANSKAMATGTVYHSIMEFILTYGFRPALADIMNVKGNYDDPSESLKKFPSCWNLAQKMVDKTLSTEGALDDCIEGAGHGLHGQHAYELYEIEQAVDDSELYILPGVKAGGYLDLVCHHKEYGDRAIMIGDWKTRGKTSWGLMPVTPADFHDTAQFAYYGACARQITGCEDVYVQHNNVFRPATISGASRVKCVGAQYSAAFLDTFWYILQTEKIPAMIRALMAGEAAERKQSGCFKYGKCANLRKCYRFLREEEEGPREKSSVFKKPARQVKEI